MNLVKDLFRSLYDVNRYTTWSKEKSSKIVGFYFFIVFMVTIVFTSFFFFSFNPAINEVTNDFKKNSPDFTFENGIFSFDHEGPYIIEPKNGEVIVIDTNKQHEKDYDNILDSYTSAVLVFSDRMVEVDGVQTITTRFSNLEGFSFDKDMVSGLIPYLKWLTPLLSIAIFMGLLIYLPAVALIISVLGLLIQTFFNQRLTFGELFKCSMFALTPVFVLECVLLVTPLSIPFIFHLIIPLIYLMFMFSNQPQKSPEINEEPRIKE